MLFQNRINLTSPDKPVKKKIPETPCIHKIRGCLFLNKGFRKNEVFFLNSKNYISVMALSEKNRSKPTGRLGGKLMLGTIFRETSSRKRGSSGLAWSSCFFRIKCCWLFLDFYCEKIGVKKCFLCYKYLYTPHEPLPPPRSPCLWGGISSPENFFY